MIKGMKKLIYSFLFVLCSVFALQAESMVVAPYNLRNANAGDSTNGNGWDNVIPTLPNWCSSMVLISLGLKKVNIISCKI